MTLLRSPIHSPIRSPVYSPTVGPWGSTITPTLGGLVANRGKIGTNFTSQTAPFTSRKTFWAHGAGDISSLQLVFVNRYLSAVGTSTAGGAFSLKFYIEYPANTFTAVLFSGSGTVALSAGARVKSDVVAGLTIPAGAKFWVRTVLIVGSAVAIPVQELNAGATVLGIDDGNVAADQGNSGTITATSGINIFGPNAIVGTVNATNARSFLIVGDSLSFGQGDDTTVGAQDSSGFLQRMLGSLGYPCMTWAKGGQQAADVAPITATLNADTASTLMSFTDVILQHGVNDLRLGRTRAQIEADLQTIAATASITGKRIWKTTITPRSTSTDSWATTVNQTAAIDGNMADLNPLNADIRAGLANMTNVIEAADAAMSARDSDIHKAPPAGTTDGTHFNSTRAALIASLLSV
jgi:lysophospholipase L1-like esterase